MDLARHGLTEDDLALRSTVREVVDDKIMPLARELDEEGRFPAEALHLLGSMGLIGVGVPEELGGSGGTKLQYAIALEEISRGCASTALTSMTQVAAATALTHGGDTEQCLRFIPAIVAGEAISCIALTEPSAGSDAASMTTRAVPAEGGYRITGSKVFITNGGKAHRVCLFARLEGADVEGITAFLVETDAEGFTASRPLQKMGMRASDTAELVLEEVFVPDSHVVGVPGRGLQIAMKTLVTARLSTAAQAVGIAQRAFELAMSYALEREQFGRRIYDFQAVQFRLVDMSTRIEAARMLTYQAARAIDADPSGDHAGVAAMAKVAASDTAMAVATDAVQTLGGYGYMREYEVERLMRDAKVTQIYDGTNDINRIVLGRALAAEFA